MLGLLRGEGDSLRIWQGLGASLLPAALVAACAARTGGGTPPADTETFLSKLVVEDAQGVIIATADLPGRAREYVVTISDGGVQLVTGVARRRRALVASKIDEILSGAALERISLREALRTGRLSCHTAFYSFGDNEFEGVGTLECLDALVLRSVPDARPQGQWPGLMASGSRSRAGMTRAREGREHVEGAASSRDHPPRSPLRVSWEEMIPILEALVILERDPEDPRAGVRLRVCAGVNHLDRVGSETRSPIIEQAAVQALIGFLKEDEGALRMRAYMGEPDFPRRALEDASVRERLIPRLDEELRRRGVALASIPAPGAERR